MYLLGPLALQNTLTNGSMGVNWQAAGWADCLPYVDKQRVTSAIEAGPTRESMADIRSTEITLPVKTMKVVSYQWPSGGGGEGGWVIGWGYILCGREGKGVLRVGEGRTCKFQ